MDLHLYIKKEVSASAPPVEADGFTPSVQSFIVIVYGAHTFN